MNIHDFIKLVQHYTGENITSDEPHVAMRCQENNITFDEIKRTLLFENVKLIRIVEDRPKVYKLYYHLSKNTELKIVVDLFVYNRVNIRTVKRLAHKFKLGAIQKQRF